MEITESLVELETVIENGLKTFVEVGRALKAIKDHKLWRNKYKSFEEYCQKRWKFGQGNAYYLISTSNVATNLDVLPSRASHVAPLRKLEHAENQNAAWQEAQSLSNITANAVAQISLKYQLIEKLGRNNFLVQAVLRGDITAKNAAEVAKVILNLPDKYITALLKFGIPSANTINQLVIMAYEFSDQVDEILTSGVLDNGKRQVKFKDLNTWDIEQYKRRLIAEKIACRQQVAKVRQAEKIQDVILDGIETLNIPQDSRLVYLFPENAVTSTQLSSHLAKNDYNIFMVVAYKNEPKINFGSGTQVSIKAVNGVKPQAVIEMMEKL